jgi:predicted nucleotidyltransferase
MQKKFSDKLTAKTFAILQNAFDELEISAYLIGAQARDVWFLPLKSPRISRDIDWVIANSNQVVFNELKTFLIQKERFSETSNPLKINSPDGIEVDLIPFDFPETPHFIGLHEIFERGTEGVIFDDGKTYQVATLPAIVLLKLIAWNNRPYYRIKDIIDITYILKNFGTYTDEDFILFTEIEAEYVPSRVIGRRINEIIDDSDELKIHVIQILEHQISQYFNSKLLQIIVANSEYSEETVLIMLKEILKGVTE